MAPPAKLYLVTAPLAQPYECDSQHRLLAQSDVNPVEVFLVVGALPRSGEVVCIEGALAMRVRPAADIHVGLRGT